jgi:Domain of unknown function (DUF4352)
VVRSAAGALGIVALFAAIVVGILASFGVIGSKAPISTPPVEPVAKTTPVEVEQVEQSAATIGEPVTAGDVSWTITDARRESEIHRFTFPPHSQPGNFVTLTFTVENVSEEPVTLTEDSLTLLNDEEQRFPAQPDVNDTYVVPEKNLLFAEASLLEPGETKEGEVNFELPPGASASMAQLGGSDPNADEEEYVDLGF